MNTAHVIALLLAAFHGTAGHLHHPVYWVGCYSQPAQTIRHLGQGACVVIRLAPHSIRVTW